MARLLAQTLTLARLAPTNFRSLATKVEVIEIDLSEEDAGTAGPGPTSSHSSSMGVAEIRRLEDAILDAMVRRAAPEWLPFMPGGSFWMPRIPELMGRLAVARAAQGVVGGEGAVEVIELDAPMTEEEALSFTTARGWPSASYFVDGKFPPRTKKTREGATLTDDEES